MADDDEDDRIFFKEALQELNIKTKIILVKDGAENTQGSDFGKLGFAK
jgi:hypothetical protein